MSSSRSMDHSCGLPGPADPPPTTKPKKKRVGKRGILWEGRGRGAEVVAMDRPRYCRAMLGLLLCGLGYELSALIGSRCKFLKSPAQLDF